MSVPLPMLDARLCRTVSLRDWKRAGTLTNLAVCIAGFCILFCFVARTGPTLVYDEPYYFTTIDLLDQHGLSLTFVREYSEGAGLLNNVMHWLLAPITGLKAPWIRWINPLILVLTVYCTCLMLRLCGSPAPGASALCLIGIPYTWVLAGMALTEMLAILLSALSVLCLLQGKRLQATRPGAAHFVAFLGGFLLGMGFLSRQPVIVLVFATPVLFFGEMRKSLRTLTSYACGAALLPIAVCSVWHGLAAPNSPHVHVGASSSVSVYHIILSLSYAAVAMLVLAPRWFVLRLPVLVFTVAVVVAANMLLGLVEINAARSVAQRLPAAIVAVWPRLVGSGMLAMAVLFCISTANRALEQRCNSNWLFFCTGMLLLIATAGKIPHQFSSRYTAMSCVMMVVAAAPYSEPTPGKSIRLTAGMLVGLLSLLSYYGSGL